MHRASALPATARRGDDTSARAWHCLEGVVQIGGESRTYRVLVREEVAGSPRGRLKVERAEWKNPARVYPNRPRLENG